MSTTTEPPYRRQEWEIDTLEKTLRTRYGDGIGATYVCTKCWRRSSDHGGKEVKGCKSSRLSIEQYTAELDQQILDLKKVLIEGDNNASLKDNIASLREQIAAVKAESSLREKDKLRLEKSIFSFGTYVNQVRAISDDLMSIVAKREAAEINEDEFLANLTGVVERQKGLDFRGGFSRADEEGAAGGEEIDVSDSDDEEEDATSVVDGTYTWDTTDAGGRTLPPAVPDPPPPVGPTLPTPASLPPTSPLPLTPAHPSLPPPAPPSRPALPPKPAPLPPAPGAVPRRSKPMLYEQPGVEIEHETNGYYCGGNCNEDRVWKVSKMNPNIHFSAGQTGLEFAKNKKKLFQHLESTCPREYIYTHIAVFVGACSFLDKQLDELREKKSYYTSFDMFFKEFQEKLYPDLQNILINEVLNFRQGVKSVRQYHSDFVNLLKEIKADEKHYLSHFVNNLSDPEIRDAMEKRPTPIHADTMSSIAEHASRIEETKSRKQKTNRKTLPTANISSASSGSNGGNGGKKKGKNNNNNNNNNTNNNDVDLQKGSNGKILVTWPEPRQRQ